MTTDKQNSGKMTQERADALKAFVRQSGGNADKEIAKLGNDRQKRPVLSEKEAKALGEEIIKESHNTKPDIEKVRALIDRGADLNATDSAGVTALMWAIIGDHKQGELAEILVHSGADVNVADRIGQTALLLAARHGQEEIAKMLLDYGADVEPKDREGETALQNAAREGYSKIVELLLESGANVDTRTNNKWTPLLSAATNGHGEIVRMLLEHGADPAQELDGCTAEKLTSDLSIKRLLRNAIEGRPYDY
jgi:ankyrin repeat protein